LATGRERQFKTIASLEELRNLSAMAEPEKAPAVFQSTIDKPEKEIFSATQLMTFMDDKKHYAQRYHMGFFEDDYEKLGLGVFEDSDALLRGTLVHRMMERFPESNLDDLFSELDISDDRLIKELKDDLKQLRDRITSSKTIAPALQAQEYRTEVSILRALGDDFITGTLDRIYKDSRDQWVIVDYKSNKIKEKEVGVAAARYQVQVEIYALLLAGLFPSQSTIEVGLYFIYPDRLEKNIFRPQQIIVLEKKYLQVINEIKHYYPYTEKLIS